MNIKNLISELKRRNVFKVATAYAIAAWLIIQVASSVFPIFDFPEWTSQFVIILVIIGFPITLIIAWAFELTPDGLKKTHEVVPGESITPRTGKTINKVIISSLSLLVLFLLTERIFFAKSTLGNKVEEVTFETASIAVLPFQDFSPEGDQEYFSDGLSEELLNVLAKVENLKVAGRTSSFKFKGQNENLQEIGRELNVNHILEGSVRKSGNRIRVTAQLIKVDDGFHVWSENFDRELTIENIFNIQDEISRTVVQELKGRLLVEEEAQIAKNPTMDIEAYNAYLEGTQLEISNREDDLWKAIDKYKIAVRIDQSFALAYARMAKVYGELNWYGNLSLEEMKTLMRDNIDQALLIDGNLGKAYEALGYYYLNTYDTDRSLETFERAIELLPNDAEVLDGYHLALEANDRFMDGVEVMRRAYELDPLNPDIATHHANHMRSIGESQEAIKILDNIIESYPNYTKAKIYKANLLSGINYGELDEAFKYAHQALKGGGADIEILGTLSWYAAYVDLLPLREHYINRIEELYPDNQRYYYLKLNLLFSQRKFDEFNAVMDEGIAMFADDFAKDANLYRAYIDLYQQNYNDAKQRMEKAFPYLLNEEVNLNEESDGVYENYITALILSETEDQEKVHILINDFCDYAQRKYDDEENEGGKVYLTWDLVSCNNFRDNFEQVVELNRHQYFKNKIKTGYVETFNENALYGRLNGYPAYEELKKEIFVDLYSMRDNIIQYLKEEGEWQEGWEESVKN